MKPIQPGDSKFQELLASMQQTLCPTANYPMVACLRCYKCIHSGHWLEVPIVSTNSQGQVTLDSGHQSIAAKYWAKQTKLPVDWENLLQRFGAIIHR